MRKKVHREEKMRLKTAAVMLSMLLLAGCGQEDSAQEANTTEVTETVSGIQETFSEIETERATVSTETEAAETETVSAETEAERASVSMETDAAGTETVSKKTNAAKTETVKTASSERAKNDAETEKETASKESTETTPGETVQAGYEITVMDKTMYAQSAVNVRTTPGTSGDRVYTLASGQQVHVIGQADTGWYQLEDGYFVSNGYLSENAPTASNTTAASTGVDTTTENNAVSEIVSGTVNVTANNAVKSYGGTSQEFVNYLNQKRAEAGLSALTWSDDIAAFAQSRAQQIVTNFSHDGSGGYGENIMQIASSGIEEWYNTWAASSGHYAAMFDQYYNETGVGFYFDAASGYYFVVENFAYRTENGEITNVVSIPAEEIHNDDLHLVNTYEGENGTVEVWGSEGVGVLTPDDPEYDDIMAAFEQERLEYADGNY